MTQDRIQDIHEYREATRSGDDLPDVKYAHEAIDELLDALKVAYSQLEGQAALSRFNEAEETQHLAFIEGSPASALPNQGGATSLHSGSITRLASASIFNNPNPWVATCGGCQQSEEFGYGTLTLTQTMTDRDWRLVDGFGWVCPKCQQQLIPVRS